MRGGDAPIELRLTAVLPALPSGAHRVSFTNTYRRDIGVYLMNALAPDDDQITIERQERDAEQRATAIEYTLASTSSAMLPLWMCAPATAAWLLCRRRLAVYDRHRSSSVADAMVRHQISSRKHSSAE